MISEKRKEASPEHGFQTVLRGFFLLMGKRNRHGRRCLVTLRRKENGWFCPAFAWKSGTKKWKLFHKITSGGKNPTKKQGTSPYNGEETTALGDSGQGAQKSRHFTPCSVPHGSRHLRQKSPDLSGKTISFCLCRAKRRNGGRYGIKRQKRGPEIAGGAVR